LFILDTTVGVEQDGGTILRRQMGQHRRMGESHHRATTLYNALRVTLVAIANAFDTKLL